MARIKAKDLDVKEKKLTKKDLKKVRGGRAAFSTQPQTATKAKTAGNAKTLRSLSGLSSSNLTTGASTLMCSW